MRRLLMRVWEGTGTLQVVFCLYRHEAVDVILHGLPSG